MVEELVCQAAFLPQADLLNRLLYSFPPSIGPTSDSSSTQSASRYSQSVGLGSPDVPTPCSSLTRQFWRLFLALISRTSKIC